jgi:peptidoglycan/xylan/chitin deacetylase (PgdA/CDA1 family)
MEITARFLPGQHPGLRPRATGLHTLVLALAAVAVGHGAAHGQGRSVALTFDDLPSTHHTCDEVEVRDVTRRLTGTLEEAGVPAAGLVTPGRSCLTTELLAVTLGRWLEIGAVLGNHTATHPDLNTTPTAAYLADLDRGQALIDAAVTTKDRWFRPPMLHSGEEPDKKRALVEHLASRGYRVAPVTVDNQEWVYATVYDHARRQGDAAMMTRLVDAYLEHLQACMAFYERLSAAVFGREIPQVLLLHANRLNADHLERVLGMLRERGYRFVSLPDAVADPAYERPDTYLGPRGLSWLQRWGLEEGVPVPDEPREAAWVARAFQELP